MSLLARLWLSLLAFVIGGGMTFMIGASLVDMTRALWPLKFPAMSSVIELAGYMLMMSVLIGVVLGFLAFVLCAAIACVGGGIMLIACLKELILYPFIRKKLDEEWSAWPTEARAFAKNNKREVLLTTASDGTHSPQKDFGSLAERVRQDDKVWPLFSATIGQHEAAWYFLGDTDSVAGITILRVNMNAVLPTAAVISKIKPLSLLPTDIVGTESISLSGDMGDYFIALTRRSQAQETLQVLSPDVLEKILFKFDACDVEMGQDHIDIIWNGVMTDTAFIEREKVVVDFIKDAAEQVDALALDPQPHFGGKTMPFSKKLDRMLKWILASIKYVGILCGIALLVFWVLPMTGIVGAYAAAVVQVFAIGILLFWPLNSLVFFILTAVIYFLGTTIRLTYQTWQRLIMRRKYLLYYAGRTV